MKKKKKELDKWNNQNWTQIVKVVVDIQGKIFEASKMGHFGKVRELQNSLIGTREAKLLAVRRVTQENMGKRTAGVDGVKKLTGEQRLKLVDKIKIDGKTSAINT